MLNRYFFFVIFIALLSIPLAEAQEGGRRQAALEPLDGSGSVHFPVSCSKGVQESFNQGVVLLHDFWHEAAERVFVSIVAADPDCAMGYWGMAISRYPLLEEIDPATLKEGSTFAAKAKALSGASKREKKYIAAVNALYQDFDKTDPEARLLAYEQAMAQLYREHPDDLEGAILYALSLLASARPTDRDLTNLKKAETILMPILSEVPNHPGALHYLIHLYDAPKRASQGLRAAEAYAKIALSPHALHMPSHLFTRLGFWQEAIEGNLASEAVAKSKMGQESGARLHAMDNLVYSYLQVGADRKAQAIVNEVKAMPHSKTRSLKAAYALAAIPAREVLEKHHWLETLDLRVRPSRYPYTEAITYFTHAVGAARVRRPIIAAQALEALRSVRDRLLATNDVAWANRTEALLQGAAAWIEYAEGKKERALIHMRAAAQIEAQPERHSFSPGPILPAGEMLGDLLMEIGEPQDALKAYEQLLARVPNRFNTLYGAARAAERSENFETAQRYYEGLVALAGESKARQRAVSEAKLFLEKSARQTGKNH